MIFITTCLRNSLRVELPFTFYALRLTRNVWFVFFLIQHNLTDLALYVLFFRIKNQVDDLKASIHSPPEKVTLNSLH